MSSTMMNGLNYFDLYNIYIYIYISIFRYKYILFNGIWMATNSETWPIVHLSILFIYLSPSFFLSLSLFENLNLTNCSINWAGRSHFLGLFQTNLNLLPTIKFRPFPPTFYYWLVVGCWLLLVFLSLCTGV